MTLSRENLVTSFAKTCANCKDLKSANDFYRDKGSKDGCASSCKDCRKSFQRAYRRRSPEVAKAYKTRNAERIKKYHQDHMINNRGMHWAISARKRLRDYGYAPVVDEFSEQQFIERYGSECFYCGGAFEEIDHFVPLSAGGTHELCNVVPTC